MTAPAGLAAPGAALTSKSPWSRIYGLGSIHAKTLRDSRLTVLIMSALLPAVVLSAAADYGKTYHTAQARAGFANLIHHLPAALSGVYGDPSPANLSTLGGMVAFKDAGSIAEIAAFWSILALSATLAAEARRGSLEFVAVTPLGRRLIALEKLAAHLTGMVIVLLVLAGASGLAISAFGTLPGDTITPTMALSFSLWVGLLALASGSIAFALSPLVGRAGAAAVAGAVTVGGFFLNGYSTTVPALSGWADLTWFGWTVKHQPLAGQFDWPSLIPVALVAVGFLALGVELFARRDLGQTTAIPWFRFPQFALGLGGPARRSLGERLPLALAWGGGIGLYGLALGAAAGSFGRLSLATSSPESVKLFHQLFPSIDLTTAGGFLQLTFVSIGSIFVGFATATLVNGWASDEARGRLEMLLSAPLGRARWALASGLGLVAAIAVMTAIMALAVGIGAATAGGDAVTPMLGTLVLGLYAAALAGIGIAVGCLIRPTIAGEAVAAVVTLTFLIDLLAPPLKLPDWVHQLALTSHLGQPMIGSWDWTGITICLALLVGGLVLSAWGLSRRDVSV
jgi:ABC-2 type transport system permease protein